MEPIYAIIDTSSYINMSAFEYVNGTLLTVFAETAVLRYSSTVNREIERHCLPKQIDINTFESNILRKISRRGDRDYILTVYNKNRNETDYMLRAVLTEDDREKLRRILQSVHYHYMPDSLERSAQIHHPKKYSQDEYEQRLFDEIAETIKDKGEKDNFVVALDLFIEDGKRNLIFLTDDDSAIKDSGCLSEVKHAFPIVKVWNSFDAVLFLYFSRKKDFPLEVAKEALNTLHKQTIPKSIPGGKGKIKMKERQTKLRNYRKSLKRIQALHKKERIQ